MLNDRVVRVAMYSTRSDGRVCEEGGKRRLCDLQSCIGKPWCESHRVGGPGRSPECGDGNRQ
jgi:hypothetical protein